VSSKTIDVESTTKDLSIAKSLLDDKKTLFLTAMK